MSGYGNRPGIDPWDFGGGGYMGHGMEGDPTIPRHRHPLDPLPHLPPRSGSPVPPRHTLDSSGTGSGTGTSGTSSGGWPTDSNGNPQPITAQQWNDIQTAVTEAFGGITGGETIQQINDLILSYLRSTGRWTDAQLQIVLQGAQSADSHSLSNPGFREQANAQGNHGGDGGKALMTGWFNHIAAALNAAQASQPPPSSGSGSNGPDQGFLQQLLNAALGSGGSGGSGGGTMGPSPSAPTMVPVTSGPSLLLPLVMAGGGAALLVWWYRKHHHGGGGEE